MRSFLSLFQSLGTAGATENARYELALAESRQAQAALIARHIGTIDDVTGTREVVAPTGREIVSATA